MATDWARMGLFGDNWGGGGALFHGGHNDLLTHPDRFTLGSHLDYIVSTNQTDGEKQIQ